MAALEHLPSRQIQQVAHIPRRQPALRRLRLALADQLGGLEQGLPEPVVETRHQPGARMAEGLQPLKHPLHILQDVEGVRQQDHIEGLLFADRFRGDCLGVGADDAQLRMPLLGRPCQRWIQFHTHAMGGPHTCQQIAHPAADLQHPQPLAHQQVVQSRQILVVRPVALMEVELGGRIGHRWIREWASMRSSRRAAATARKVRRVGLEGFSSAAWSRAGWAAQGLKR